jgi:hypothetical protein
LIFARHIFSYADTLIYFADRRFASCRFTRYLRRCHAARHSALRLFAAAIFIAACRLPDSLDIFATPRLILLIFRYATIISPIAAAVWLLRHYFDD